MRRLPIVLLTLVALVLPACPDPTTPTTLWDGGTVTPDPVLPPGVDPAEEACKRLEELQCISKDGRPLWEPTPGGVSCVDVFRISESNGVNLHPACIARIKTCEERHVCTDKG